MLPGLYVSDFESGNKRSPKVLWDVGQIKLNQVSYEYERRNENDKRGKSYSRLEM